MRRYLARGVGILIGVPAGPIGIVFGFLVGALVDQYRVGNNQSGRFQRYLGDPRRERNPNRIREYLVAALLGDLFRRSLAMPEEELDRLGAYAAAQPWPGDAQRRRVSIYSQRRRGYISIALRRGQFVDFGQLLDNYHSHYGSGGNVSPPEIVAFLVAVIRGTRGSIEIETFRFFVELTDRWGIDGCTIQELMGTPILLDDEACTVLGVSRSAQREEVRRAYRLLATNLHPDTGSVLEQQQQRELSDVFLRIRSAYDLLATQLDEIEHLQKTVRSGTG